MCWNESCSRNEDDVPGVPTCVGGVFPVPACAISYARDRDLIDVFGFLDNRDRCRAYEKPEVSGCSIVLGVELVCPDRHIVLTRI